MQILWDDYFKSYKNAFRILPAFFIILWFSFQWSFADGLVTTELVQWVREKYGSSAAERMRDWQRLMLDNAGKDENEKLEVVNNFFNRLAFRSDWDIWGKEDYWATPAEAIGKGQADCEDFSVAKYFTLREMGVPDERMRIMYVKALEYDQAHMVLTYYPDPASVPLVLDNLNDDILSANKRSDLLPVYSFNGEGLWQAKNRGRGKKLGSSKRVTRWEGLRSRMKKEMDNNVSN